jgi:hypothetical protein
MNVQAGDTAMMTDPENYGRLVHVDQPHEDYSFITHQRVWRCTALQTIRCGYVHGGHYGDQPPGQVICAYDRQLRPIRDNDGTDEVIRKVGLPKVNEPAPKQVEHAR